MKGFAKIALSIALLAIVVLSIVVASVAWFTSNPEVNTNEVTLNAARTLTVTFESELDGSTNNKGYLYNGQTGTSASGDDAPYVYEAGSFSVSIHPSGEGRGGKVKIEFGSVEIKYGRNAASYTSGTIPDVLLTDLFVTTANCYSESDDPDPSDPDDNYVNVDGLYVRDDGTHSSDQHYKKTNYEIDDDGYVKDNGAYAVLPEGTYGFTFTFTFLPETAYAVWQNAAKVPPTASFDDVYGYEVAAGGDYIGIVSYVSYEAKYHKGLQRYSRSGDSAPYTYTPSATGEYVRAVTSYASYSSVTKYTNAEGEGSGAANGAYIRIEDSNDYVTFRRYNRINGFPYSAEKYMDATYTFDVTCSVDEAEVA